MTQDRNLVFDESTALRLIVEGTAKETGEQFFRSLVRHLAMALNVTGAWVTEYDRRQRMLRSHALWINGDFVNEYNYQIEGTPCERVIEDCCLTHYVDNIVALFPQDPDLPRFGAVSYMGTPFLADDGTVLGHLAVLDSKSMPEEARALAIFRIFAARAGAEARRLKAEKIVRDQEAQLRRLVNSARDAILEIDSGGKITLANQTAADICGCSLEQLCSKQLSEFVSAVNYAQIIRFINELEKLPPDERWLWLPDPIAITSGKAESQVEVMLSCLSAAEPVHFTIVLRNLNDRVETENRINRLSAETEYLKAEINQLQRFHGIIGTSKPMQRVIKQITQVGGTEASVLITGETGTGKEVVARAIHHASRRSERALIKVNCAAMPANLIESELFGHEKGAFTGATTKRLGRFALADGGTIFLDEIGELPLELQPKLLRVLQEGEFEAVGSSKTTKVDVRIIAATNLNLTQAVADGKFREDLFYRLNVFPIVLPPLRDRGEDIIALAESFLATFAKELGRPFRSLSDTVRNQLLAYSWPGNVRELQNVIERSVIISDPRQFSLARELPLPTDAIQPSVSTDILTAEQIAEIEKANIVRALEFANWQVSGQSGAASLLGLPPTTLSSRMKALGIARNRQ